MTEENPINEATGEARRAARWNGAVWSLAGLLSGAVVGSLLGAGGAGQGGWLLTALSTLGSFWVNALRVVALPLAVGNTVCAVVRQRSSRAAGEVGAAVGAYVVLLLLGATLVLLVVPPVLRLTPVDAGAISTLSEGATEQARKLAGEGGSRAAGADWVTGLVPRNLVRAAVNEEFLGLLIFAFAFGLAVRQVKGSRGEVLLQFFEGFTEALMILVRWIIAAAPVALFALAAVFAANSGARLAGILGEFVALECGLMLAFVALLYPLCRLLGGVPLRAFARAAAGPQMVAISTRSSIAALPALLEAGARLMPENVAATRVVLPLSVAMFKVNRTTSALCRLVVIWYFWSVPFEPARICVFLATVLLLSFSDLGLPSVSHMRTFPAYLAAGCPMEAVVVMEVVEPFSDVCKTLLNVTGDLAIAAVVARWRRQPAEAPALAEPELAVP